MTEPLRLLIVEDDRTIRDALGGVFRDAGYTVDAADGIGAAERLLALHTFAAVLLDIRLKDGDGLQLLESLRKRAPQLPVIMATSYGDSERTIRAMRLGAFEYVTKPFELDALLGCVARAVRSAPPIRVEPDAKSDVLIGSSPEMLKVWKAIGRAADSRAPVLITGETGVGKELVARAIHQHGLGPGFPFVAVNVAALPATLIESELFGHEKGAFTGAVERHEGRFELARDGTLFLDEIGDLDPKLQTQLLRVCEDGGFERVGGTTRLSSKARLVAATSRPVTPGSAGATLREDLYYRLGVIRIDVPPLVERRQDIPLLVDAFLRSTGPTRRAVSEEAMLRLVDHDWPGNVRQLRHVIESACVMSRAEVLDVDDLQLPSAQLTAAPGESDLDLRRNLERLERQLIERALLTAQGNRAGAARLLGIRRALLYARMRHLGMPVDTKE